VRLAVNRRRFAQLHTSADIELPAAVVEAHETLSRPAKRRILGRERESLTSRSMRAGSMAIENISAPRHIFANEDGDTGKSRPVRGDLTCSYDVVGTTYK
jgi:hypothetical protein